MSNGEKRGGLWIDPRTKILLFPEWFHYSQCIPVVCFCRFHVPDGDPSFAGNIQQYGAGTQGGYKNRGNFRAADL